MDSRIWSRALLSESRFIFWNIKAKHFINKLGEKDFKSIINQANNRYKPMHDRHYSCAIHHAIEKVLPNFPAKVFRGGGISMAK